MVLKITDLRKQYGVFQSFETEAEALAYEEERQQNLEELIAQKISELKALYNSNPQKYAKFKNFTDEEWRKYALVCLNASSATTLKYAFCNLPSIEKDPELAKWAKFTYVEILQMESTGVLIPKEILAWAHSMQDSDVTAYEINDDPNATETANGTGVNSSNSELLDMQKKAQTLSNKSKNTQTEINQNFEAFQEIAKQAEQIKKEQETTKKDSLKQIEELTKEWDEISAKIKKGDKLSESEQKRYKELGSMLNGKDGELVTEIQASTDDLKELMNSMDGLDADIQTGIEIGDETIEIAKQLSNFEKSYGLSTFKYKDTVDMTTGDIKNVLVDSKGKDLAKEALNNGNNLIEFSNILSDQLLMNQYASLYDFAEIFTQTSTETITNTKEVLGDDFNKTTEELNKQIDTLPDMTDAENDRYNLEQNGVGLVGQSLYFTKKSSGEIFNSLMSIIELTNIQKQSNKEKAQSQTLTDKVTNEMTTKKEEVDKLNEKKEKAEENKKLSEDAAIDAQKNNNLDELEEAAKNAEQNDEEEFTEQDQQTLDRLNSELKTTGNESQRKLFQSLSKVDGLDEILKTGKIDGLSAIDYGQISQEVGLALMEQVPPIFFLWYIFMIGLMAYTTGAASKAIGEENNVKFDETGELNQTSKSSIGQNQLSIQEITNIEAINLVSPAEGENNSAQAENNNTEETNDTVEDENTNSPTSDQNETDVAENINIAVEKNPAEQDTKTVSISNEESTIVNETAEELSSTPKAEDDQSIIKNNSQTDTTNENSKTEGSDNADDEEEMSTDSAQGSVDDMQSKTEEENDESIENKKDTEKTEKELEKEMKVLEKNMKNDQKELEKIAKESQKITKEKEQLAAEFEMLNTQNEEIIARQESSQQNQANGGISPILAQDEQQGGLLTSGVQQNTMAVSGDDNSTLQTNQDRIVSISSRFKALDEKLNVNQTKVRNIGSTSRKRYNKFEKLAKAKEKIIKQNQKVEQEKQAKVQKSLATVSIINNVFSITLSAGTILIAIGSAMPFGTGAPLIAAGSIMVKIGTYGMASCAVLKSTILIANGNFEAAFTTMAMTAVQIATSMIPGVGAASGAVSAATATTTQAVAAGLNIVSAATDTVAQSQTLAGKEQSGWLNTVSQVAGAASVLTNVAGGFTNAKQVKLDNAGNAMKDASGKVLTETTKSAFSQANTFGKTLQIAQAVGSTASTTAQISALIKQANGEDPGKFENIMNIIGSSISTAAALGQIGMKIAEAASNRKEINNDNKNENVGEIEDEKENNVEKGEDDKSIPESLAAMMKNDEILPQISDPKNDLQKASNEALAAISGKNTNISPEVSKEINEYTPETETPVIAQNEENSNPVVSKEIKEKIDKEMSGVSKAEIDEENKPEEIMSEAERKKLKQEKVDRVMDITTNALGAGAQVMQAVSAVNNLNTQTPDDTNEAVLKLSNMKKGKSLIRKIKKRRAALYGYSRSA